MDQSKIAEMKATIKAEYEDRIKKLKDEMEKVISALSVAEGTLSGGQKTNPLPFVPQIPHLLKRKDVDVGKNKTADQRVRNALTEMTGDFLRKTLLKKANSDGLEKEIKGGTFGGIFSDLQKEKKIIVVQEKKGRQPALYRRTESSTASLNSSTFAGGKGV